MKVLKESMACLSTSGDTVAAKFDTVTQATPSVSRTRYFLALATSRDHLDNRSMALDHKPQRQSIQYSKLPRGFELAGFSDQSGKTGRKFILGQRAGLTGNLLLECDLLTAEFLVAAKHGPASDSCSP